MNVVQSAYPGSSAWLISCSASEGGHGGFVWFEHLSYPKYGYQTTPGGNLQYMQRTFWGDYNAAIADLHSRNFKEPAGSASYYSPLGQAIAGAWAYSHKGTGQWTGGGC